MVEPAQHQCENTPRAPRTIADILQTLPLQCTDGHITVGRIVEVFQDRGFGFILLIFALPMALPLPVPPGINIVLASPLILLTVQQATGRHTVWLPAGIKKKKIHENTLRAMTARAVPLMRKLDYVTKPRLPVLTGGLSLNLVGALGFIMALAICVPLPLTNTVPSLGIALMAAGTIMRDGILVIAGAITGTMWVMTLCIAILFLGGEGIEAVQNALQNMI